MKRRDVSWAAWVNGAARAAMQRYDGDNSATGIARSIVTGTSVYVTRSTTDAVSGAP